MDKAFTSHLRFRRAARFTVSLAVTLLIPFLLGTVEAVKAQETAPKPPEVKKLPGKPLAVAPKPTAAQLKTWHKTLSKVSTPKVGCYAANYPNTTWRGIPCSTPPHKLYLPKIPGRSRVQQVGGGSNADFVAVVTGNMTEADGSFDSISNLTSECNVQCQNQTCPATPSCSGQPSNSFSLQLNTNPMSNPKICRNSPGGDSGGAVCQSWEQFVYAQTQNCSGCTGSSSIQYWILNFGPAGTTCPSPVASASTCNSNGGVVSSQWCPFQFSPTGNVFCVMNSAGSVSPPTEPISSLNELELDGDTANGGATADSVTTFEGGIALRATGNNVFTDLGTLWKDTEFNVFGNANGSEAVFNTGANIHVRNGVSSGTTNGPGCSDQSFTGESNNLNLGNSAPAAVVGAVPALLWSESNPATAGVVVTCADATSVGTATPPPPSVIKAKITIETGNDDARSDTELQATINGEPAFCLKPSNNANSDGVCNNGGSAHDQNGQQSWNNFTSSTQTFNLVTPQPLSAINSMTISLFEHNSGFESDDNWDIQGITVVLTDTTGATKTVLTLSNPNNGNNCIARLKGSPNSTTVKFGLNGTNSHVYAGGNANGQTTTCANNGG
jgi:hypothetical protein